MSVLLPNRQRTTLAFLGDWTPERLLSCWIDEVSALGIAPHRLLESVPVSGSEAQLLWWPRAELPQLRIGAARHVAHPDSGPQQTLAYLQQAHADPRACAAVLLAASLFARVERTRARYPREAWPPFNAAQTLLAWTRARHDYRWPSDCAATLPTHLAEDGLVLGSLQQLVRFCAVEHARVLHRLAPVQLTAASLTCAPRFEVLTLSQPAPSLPAPAHSLAAPRDRARRRDPRWSELTRADLEALIWAKPQRELAREFGVSEATVARRCKLLSIAKPERGFWHKGRAAAAR